MSRREGFEVVATRSGARAMLDHATGEVMHPLIGPLREVEALYVGPSRLATRLALQDSEPLTLLDVGLGAGSNAAAAWALSEARTGAGRPLRIISFDRTLAAFELGLEPDHREDFGFVGTLWNAATRVREHGHAEGARTTWRLSLGELPSTFYAEPAGTADVVYWDPYSPRANPELWTVSAFTALRRLCREGATVHTYSGATATRTALLLAGFAVGFGQDLTSGRRATVAATRLEDLAEPLDRRWFERLERSSAPFPPDAPPEALARVRALPQFGEHG